jgi:hypothetical protein
LGRDLPCLPTPAEFALKEIKSLLAFDQQAII